MTYKLYNYKQLTPSIFCLRTSLPSSQALLGHFLSFRFLQVRVLPNILPLHNMGHHFSSFCYCFLVCAQSPSRVQPFVTPWTVAQQALLSMEFSRQEYWRGLAISYLFPCHVLMQLKATATYILGNTLLLVLISILERFHYNISSYPKMPRSQQLK